jgi:hypothetical protein
LKAPAETQCVQELVLIALHFGMLIDNVLPALMGQVDLVPETIRKDVPHIENLSSRATQVKGVTVPGRGLRLRGDLGDVKEEK